ncbi:mitogen-activated protein kinase kinase kinase NPK1 [Lathyrus oleraceus]|uniref:mitogen-activated protein kinase kinase kinase NPK1 n=1 Tax=Pisum sativum TaxID=3888 RepID=UPI0021CE8A9F|nr:mitogen-activated protein kinase kinase kinase NPK1-like [Pisum sativum]
MLHDRFLTTIRKSLSGRGVIRTYTKQLLEGLEYLHNNRIIHRDIKGANILVDNKGCIKLADFGASRKVVELATINGAKSIKGTPHWMSPEVILQTGYTTSADIWSVACTVIEMATGKPPWSQQYPQGVSTLFYIGTTRSHPPIPEHLSAEAKDFLLKCFHKEPDLRPSASDLLLHPFITCEYQESHSISRSSVRDSCNRMATDGMNSRNFLDSIQGSTCTGLKDVCQMDSLRFSNANLLKPGSYQGAGNYDDDMCQMDDEDDIFAASSVKANPLLAADDIKSFNPMCEPVEDGWSCKSDETLNLKKSRLNLSPDQTIRITMSPKPSPNAEKEFSFSSEPLGVEDDDEVTECKIRAFLDDKAFELNKLLHVLKSI